MPEELDIKQIWSNWDRWIRRNWFTLLGIIIILLVVGYYMSNVEDRVIVKVKECNQYWRERMVRYCPEASDSGWMDLEEIDETQ